MELALDCAFMGCMRDRRGSTAREVRGLTDFEVWAKDTIIRGGQAGGLEGRLSPAAEQLRGHQASEGSAATMHMHSFGAAYPPKGHPPLRTPDRALLCGAFAANCVQ